MPQSAYPCVFTVIIDSPDSQRTFRHHAVRCLSTERRQNEDELFQSVVAYMEDNISEHLTIEQICHDNLVGRGILQKVFSDNVGCGIIDYFSLMKINAAKQLIRENKMNFSQIAEELGYNSIHYFSRHFKNITGMTPSDYATGVRHPDC